jgi:ABC-2 type transport system ATP-binding protein
VKMLTTMLPPSSGRATIAGYDIVRAPSKVRAHIGYVPQLLSADGSLTGYENLLFSARLYLIPRRDREARIGAALDRMGLADAADRLVQGYSGGMIRRLEIAQSMIHEPPVLFMDEPTVGLDPVARRAVWDHVRQLRATLGTTIVVTTHLMDEADEMCDRLGVLHAGKLAEIGTPAQLKAHLGPGATLTDVFASVTGLELESGGSYRDVRQTRRSAQSHE